MCTVLTWDGGAVHVHVLLPQVPAAQQAETQTVCDPQHSRGLRNQNFHDRNKALPIPPAFKPLSPSQLTRGGARA